MATEEIDLSHFLSQDATQAILDGDSETRSLYAKMGEVCPTYCERLYDINMFTGGQHIPLNSSAGMVLIFVELRELNPVHAPHSVWSINTTFDDARGSQYTVTPEMLIRQGRLATEAELENLPKLIGELERLWGIPRISWRAEDWGVVDTGEGKPLQ